MSGELASPHRVDAISFDRDLTIDVGLAPGPVPLSWVRDLVDGGPAVYAHGDQRLVEESGANSLERVAKLLKFDSGTHPEVILSRIDRIELIQQLHPDATTLYAVDDAFKLGVDDADVPDGWTLFTPEEFVTTFEDAFGGEAAEPAARGDAT